MSARDPHECRCTVPAIAERSSQPTVRPRRIADAASAAALCVGLCAAAGPSADAAATNRPRECGLTMSSKPRAPGLTQPSRMTVASRGLRVPAQRLGVN
jgi:hypothetical protein